jgi:hypothetical protein
MFATLDDMSAERSGLVQAKSMAWAAQVNAPLDDALWCPSSKELTVSLVALQSDSYDFAPTAAEELRLLIKGVNWTPSTPTQPPDLQVRLAEVTQRVRVEMATGTQISWSSQEVLELLR